MTDGDFRVLVVDDNEMNRDALARRLKHQGFTVTLASNGREALALASSQGFDLILLDIMMPEIDGYQVLETLKADPDLRNIPIIMLSALEELDSVMKCMELGAEDYLTKPFDPILLKAAIARCLKKSPTPVASNIPRGQVTVLQPRIKNIANDAEALQAEQNKALTLDEVATSLVRSGKMSRKGYMHFSKAIFNTAFANHALTKQECEQIKLIFHRIQTGHIKITD